LNLFELVADRMSLLYYRCVCVYVRFVLCASIRVSKCLLLFLITL